MNSSKFFILTVDTEPDNEWSRLGRDEMTCHNAQAIPRFHALCRQFDIRPVYLIDYQMSCNSVLKKYLSTYLERGECEIGAHLHPWSTPPYEYCVTDDDFAYHPFCTEYPQNAFLAKLENLIGNIKDNFHISPETFRAGRYVINKECALSLKNYGFRVDCSVTPFRRWEPERNAPGSDYTDFTPKPFFWDKEKELLEVPLSAMIIKKSGSLFNPYQYGLASYAGIERALDKILGSFRFSLKGGDWFFRYKKYESLEYFIRKYVSETDLNLVQGMLHSSELILGGCFKDKKSLDKYWETLRHSFEFMRNAGYKSKTHSEFFKLFPS